MNRMMKAAAIVAAIASAVSCSSDDPAESVTSMSVSATATSAPSSVLAGSAAGWIAHQRFPGGRSRIFLIRPDGTGGHELTPDLRGGQQTNPDWSPDGERLAFAQGNGSTEDLWVVDVDGDRATLMLGCEKPCVAIDDPAWTPDGRSIMFSRLAVIDGVGIGTLELVDVRTQETTVLLTAGPTDFYSGPRLSPDGRSVALEVAHTDGSGPFEAVNGVELAVVDLTVSPPSIDTITPPDLYAATADWSPDGQRIVYSALATASAVAPDLFTIRPDGSDVTQLTSLGRTGGSAEHPDYTNDGSGVLFAGVLANGDGGLIHLDLADGSMSPATGTSYRMGVHPRTQPTP